jgi:hypothetical protein
LQRERERERSNQAVTYFSLRIRHNFPSLYLHNNFCLAAENIDLLQRFGGNGACSCDSSIRRPSNVSCSCDSSVRRPSNASCSCDYPVRRPSNASRRCDSSIRRPSNTSRRYDCPERRPSNVPCTFIFCIRRTPVTNIYLEIKILYKLKIDKA